MSAYYIANTHRLSASAFAWGDLVYTEYATGCLRKILISSCDVSTPIDPKYGELGALNEDRHQKSLDAEGVPYLREVEYRGPIGHGVDYIGHADFVISDSGGNPVCIDELKSVQSKKSRLRYIRKGEYLVENLAQVVAYMAAARVSSGRLIYTYWERIPEDGPWMPLEERIFTVAIDDFGRVLVDSKPSKFTVYDLFAHQSQAASAIGNGHVMQRPLNWDAPFVSPCAYCLFAEACDQYDAGKLEGKEAFVNYAKEFVK